MGDEMQGVEAEPGAAMAERRVKSARRSIGPARRFARWFFTNELGLVVGIVLTLVSAWCCWGLFVTGRSYLNATALLWALWATLPPFYFLAQWYGFEREHEDELTRQRRFEDMKYGHDVAGKFWLGGVAVLSGVLLKVYEPNAVGGMKTTNCVEAVRDVSGRNMPVAAAETAPAMHAGDGRH